MTPEEFFNHPEVRKTLALTYWRGRLHGQLFPGLVPLASFEEAALGANTRAGGLEALYDSLVGRKRPSPGWWDSPDKAAAIEAHDAAFDAEHGEKAA